ncbi:alkylglycerol monooxygenase isoform X2 [Cherax quadricarinatus]|nr:alkylglycerol monooxygenase-like isoform X2 [Cherax quadricarinatus]
MLFITFLEFTVLYMLGKPTRLGQLNSSLGCALFSEVPTLVVTGASLIGYDWIFKFRLWDLPWDSPYTWLGAFTGIDFCYYWIHRANHELNILWAIHQVHHSSEDYNFGTAMRNSVFQRATNLAFYYPLALLGLPLPTIAVHIAFNYLFQFWLHTELVGNLGPIEWFFITPSHHRVHHGANKWCLDKNYGSVLVIWDRFFGTFEAERNNEEIVYGLTNQPQTYNVIWHQFFYFVEVYRKARSMSTWGDSLKALFYGPGWTPGMPRLGDPSTFTDVKAPRVKYDPRMSLWMFLYIVSHLALALLAQHWTVSHYMMVPSSTVFSVIIFVCVTVSVMSALFDRWPWAPVVETARCAACILCFTTRIIFIPAMDTAILVVFSASLLYWTMMLSFSIMTKKIK